ncbi:hypothetical protein LAJ19_18475 (plasmid) [Deinococcus taeanensis]|uniref:hypothetical protein n=1 Tax=Deinococcus taeanensis TaxID=2737050 RepID=UPI001CDCCD8A|nr:hypothetical protein [Deinococcus taeanensis]UBV45104.1 hypothetical protein LAJ19_18475 [Deinococcus taeanensis]
MFSRHPTLDAICGNPQTLDPKVRTLLERTPRTDVELYLRLTSLGTDAILLQRA